MCRTPRLVLAGFFVTFCGLWQTPPSQCANGGFALPSITAAAVPSPNNLSLFKTYFVTGDYAVAGVGVRGRGTGAINMAGVPADADVLGAYLYWETLGDGRSGTFRGNAIVGTALGTAGSPCWPQPTITVYRADVLRFLPVDANGRFIANGSHVVTFPDSGDFSTAPSTEGASLVVIYSDPGLAFRSVVIYDGAFTVNGTQPQFNLTVRGFGQSSSANPQSKMTHIVGDGQTGPGFSDRLLINGVIVGDPNDAFKGAQGPLWDNLTIDTSGLVGTNSSQITTAVDNTPFIQQGFDCLTWGAVVFSTTVEAAPQVALPVVDPAAVRVGTHPVITVSVSISYPDNQPVIPSSVKLLEIDDKGQATILATLNDNGTDGDAMAGDSIFSGRVQLHAAPIGLIRLQVSAVFSNTPGTVLSPVATVEVFPSPVPLTIQSSDLEQCVNSPGGGQFISNELLMFFEPGTHYSTVSQTARSVTGTVIGLQSFPRFNIWQVRIQCSSASCVEAAVDALQGDPNILRAEPNFCTDTLGVTPNDPLFGGLGGQYGPQRIEADKAWAITKGNLVTERNSFPIIGIVDSGIDDTHLEFAGRVVKAKNYTDAMFMDDCGHGTAVAGVAGATGNNRTDIAGISWHAQLVDLKVARLTADPMTGNVKCKGTTLAGAAAFREAANRGATVINYSIGNKKRNKAEAEGIDYVNKADRLLVAAAGNDNSNVKIYPAGFGRRQECFGLVFRDCYDATNVSVGATDRNDMRWVDPASGGGSNYGDWVLFYAPGANIRTTQVGGGTRTASGTSFAAPHVAGTASLAKASDPNRSMFSVYLRLGDDQVGNDPNGNPMARINAFKTVLAVSAKNCGTCPDAPTVKVNPRDATVNIGTTDVPRDGRQAISVHGVSIPLDAAAGYEVRFGGTLSTWDSCSAMQGFRDCFSVSVSAKPFWMITRDDRDLTLNPSLSVGFVWGGMTRGSQTLQTLNIIQSFANMAGRGADNFLNVVLDTAAGTNPDNAFPSWGTIRILDITPR
jgi:hypothetical protein